MFPFSELNVLMPWRKTLPATVTIDKGEMTVAGNAKQLLMREKHEMSPSRTWLSNSMQLAGELPANVQKWSHGECRCALVDYSGGSD
jgi:hypothetical protein